MKLKVFLLLIIATLSLNSQTKYSVSGLINDLVSKEAVISATVALYTDSIIRKDNFIKGAYSNKFGFYSLPNIENGTYYIVISSVGYNLKMNKLILTNSDIRENILLESVSLQTQELTVTADRESSPTNSISSISISPSFINKMPAFGGEVDIFRTLQLLPGIASGSELSSGLYVRGGSPDQNLILLDGVTVYNPSHLAGFISSFNNDAIKDIRMIKGAFPAEYGGRLSSVLDLTMKEGTKDKLSGKAGISLISSKLTLEGPINENSSFMISGRRFYFDLLLGLITEDTPTYYFYDFNAKVNYKLSDNDIVYVSGYFARDVFGVDEDRNSDISIDWGNSTANFRWMHIVSPELFTNFSLIYTDYSFNSNFNEESNSFGTGSRIRDIVLKGDAQYIAYDNHNIKSGLDVTWHNFNASANIDIGENTPDLSSLGQGDINTFDIATYVQDEWKVTDKLDVNMGLRAYYFQQGSYFDLEPRLSATYLLDNGIRLKAAAAVANQYIHLIVRNNISLPTDLWFPSTENLKPSRSYQAVLGAETNLFDDSYLFSVEGYYKKMNNLLEYRDDAEFTIGIPLEEQFTKGEGRAYGVELFLNKKIGDFSGWIGYTLAWTKRQFPDLNNGKEFYPRYDRRHDVSVTLNYELSDSWELGASWVYGTGQAFTLPTSTYFWDSEYYAGNKYEFSDRNGVRLPAYHRMDVNFMYKFTAYKLPWIFSINIYNVYNRRNPFAWYIDTEYDDTYSNSKKVLKQITLFPLIPTFGLSFEF